MTTLGGYSSVPKNPTLLMKGNFPMNNDKKRPVLKGIGWTLGVYGLIAAFVAIKISHEQMDLKTNEIAAGHGSAALEINTEIQFWDTFIGLPFMLIGAFFDWLGELFGWVGDIPLAGWIIGILLLVIVVMAGVMIRRSKKHSV